jgi:hypothetical protein
MGTRGAYGFRINEQDKVTYNHFDSYPSCLGKEVMSYIARTPLDRMKQVAARIKLVDRESAPSPELIHKYKSYANLRVSQQRYEDWYCLLRETQGDLFPYNNDLEHMIDSQDFLSDSLFCEWAYIINLDAGRFEVYRGFNKDRSARGRYALRSVDSSDGYWGVALIKEISLLHITKQTLENVVSELKSLERV